MNVYLYRSKYPVAAYNGTTENHKETKESSETSGALPASDIDMEAAFKSSEPNHLGDASEVTKKISCSPEGLHVSGTTRIDDENMSHRVKKGLLSTTGKGNGENPTVLDTNLSPVYINNVTHSEDGEIVKTIKDLTIAHDKNPVEMVKEIKMTEPSKRVVSKGDPLYPTSKETPEELVAACEMTNLAMCDGDAASENTFPMDDDTKSTNCTHTAGRGLVHYAGSTVKHNPEKTVGAFIPVEHVGEPRHEDFATDENRSATTTS